MDQSPRDRKVWGDLNNSVWPAVTCVSCARALEGGLGAPQEREFRGRRTVTWEGTERHRDTTMTVLGTYTQFDGTLVLPRACPRRRPRLIIRKRELRTRQLRGRRELVSCSASHFFGGKNRAR